MNLIIDVLKKIFEYSKINMEFNLTHSFGFKILSLKNISKKKAWSKNIRR